MKKSPTIIVLITCLLISLAPLRALSCGPNFSEAFFSFVLHPDFPLRRYAQGELGVLKHTYARSYLYTAYRVISNAPLSPDEQSAIVRMWDDRLRSEDYSAKTAPEQWLADRNKIPGVSKITQISQNRPVTLSEEDQYESYLNCPDSAFDTARQTLRERSLKYGETSETLKEWIDAQDKVFCHCGGPQYQFKEKKYSSEPPFPAAAKSTADALTKADREYQTACAHFYAQMFDEAHKEFDRIAGDQSSPWKDWAPYLVARCQIRQALLPKQINKPLLESAERLLGTISAGQGNKEVRTSAKQLLGYVVARLHPEARLVELAQELTSGKQSQGFGQSLNDYLVLLDRYLGSGVDFDPAPPVAFNMIATIAPSAVTQWITCVQAGDPAAKEFALHQYKTDHSVLWLVPTIMWARASDSDSNILVAAAEKVSEQSPAFFTTKYHLIRLLIESGKFSEAKAELNKILVKWGPSLPPSALNDFMDYQTKLAGNFTEFWQSGIRQTACVAVDVDGLERPETLKAAEASKGFLRGPVLITPEVAKALNLYTPLTLLGEMAKTPKLSTGIRRDVIQAVWTRSVLLGDQKLSTALTPLLCSTMPAAAALLKEFSSATSDQERHFISAYLLLKNPGMRPVVTGGAQRETAMNRIDDYQDNWWCVGSKPDWGSDKHWLPQQAKTEGPPKFLSQADKALAAREQKALLALGQGPTYLLRQTVSWAKKHPTDSRLPEALALAVRAPKFGCTDDSTSELSKAGYQILHKNFPHSPYTNKTKYWY